MTKLGDLPPINLSEDLMELKGALKPKDPGQFVVGLGKIGREFDSIGCKRDGLVRVPSLPGTSGFPIEPLGENRKVSDPLVQF